MIIFCQFLFCLIKKYVFTLNDIVHLQDLPIVITAKDAVKIKQLINADNAQYFENIWVLPVECVVSFGVYELMDNLLNYHNII